MSRSSPNPLILKNRPLEVNERSGEEENTRKPHTLLHILVLELHYYYLLVAGLGLLRHLGLLLYTRKRGARARAQTLLDAHDTSPPISALKLYKRPP